MTKTPDEILVSPAAHKAILKYVQQEAIGFAEWVDINAIRSGEHEWTCRTDNYKKKYTTEQLYNSPEYQLYKQQKA